MGIKISAISQELSAITGNDYIIVSAKDGTVYVTKKFKPGTMVNQNSSDYMPYNLPIATKTNDYTITTSDYTILLDGSSNTVTATLPTAVGIAGRIFNIKCIDDTFTCTAQGNGSETIDDDASVTLIKRETITVQSDGSNWVII